jgi:hypothetical protein
MARFTRAHAISTYGKAEIVGINNEPGIDVDTDSKLTSNFIYTNLDKLFTNCVIPIQNAFDVEGVNIGITSCYRSKAWNEYVEGVEDSHHISGYAVDLISTKHPTYVLFNWCKDNLPLWNQLIWEFPEKGPFIGSGKDCSWVHISFIEGNNPKTLSVASALDSLHDLYTDSDTFRRGNYTHHIKEADLKLLAEAKGDNETYTQGEGNSLWGNTIQSSGGGSSY